tara:strand:+ start:5194 stop:5439 length:246 start_codon:yes stop_codon:yes gene_type:complete
MDKNKFKIGDLVRWKPSRYDRAKGDTEDTGVVIEIGETATSFSSALRRYALINWAQIGPARIICEDSSWEKTHIIARADNV